MSLDVIQNKPGQLAFVGQPTFGTTGTASTIGSNQYPAGYGFGNVFAINAATNSTNGGAMIVAPIPRAQASTDMQAPASSGVITHDGGGLVVLSGSAAAVYKLQPAQFHGQMLTVLNMNAVSASLVSTVNTTGVNGTTTANIPVLDGAYTIGSSGCLQFVGLAQRGGTATNSLPIIWCRIASM